MAQHVRPLVAAFAWLLAAAALVAAEGIDGHVVSVDHKKQCLGLEWDNDTVKPVCWTAKTKFSVLETGDRADPADIRKGTYLRMQGAHKEGTYWASEVVIWEAASIPTGK